MRQWPLPNVWLGVSVEDQKRADERIPYLLTTPAAVRLLSCEPLLGPVRIRDHWLIHHHPGDAAIDWVIVVGESGDRKSVVEGKRVSVRVDIGGCRLIKKKTNLH